MKKTLLSLSTLAMITSPIIAVVSCAGEEPTQPNEGQQNDSSNGETQNKEAKIATDLAKFDDAIVEQSLSLPASIFDLHTTLKEEELVNIGLTIPESTEGVKRTYIVDKVDKLEGTAKIQVIIGDKVNLKKITYIAIDNFIKLTPAKYKIDKISDTLKSFLGMAGVKLDQEMSDNIGSLLYKVMKSGLKEIDVQEIAGFFDFDISPEINGFIKTILSSNLLPRMINGGFIDFGIDQNDSELNNLIFELGKIIPLPISQTMTNQLVQGLLHGFSSVEEFKNAILELLNSLNTNNQDFENQNQLLEIALSSVIEVIYNQIPLFKSGIINASAEDWRQTILFDYRQITELINLIPEGQEILATEEFAQFTAVMTSLQEFANQEPELCSELTSIISTFLQKGITGLNDRQIQLLSNLIDSQVAAKDFDSQALSSDILNQEVDTSSQVYQLLTMLIANQEIIIELFNEGLSGPNAQEIIKQVAHIVTPIVSANVDSLPSFLTNSILEGMIVSVVKNIYDIVFEEVDGDEDDSVSVLPQEQKIWEAELAKFTPEIKNQVIQNSAILPKVGQKITDAELTDLGIIIPEAEENVLREFIISNINPFDGSVSLRVIEHINSSVDKVLNLTIDGFEKTSVVDYNQKQLMELISSLLNLVDTGLTTSQEEILVDDFINLLSNGLNGIGEAQISEIFAAFNLPTETSDLLSTALNSEILQKLIADGFGNLSNSELSELIKVLQEAAPADIKPFLSQDLVKGIFNGFKSATALTDALWDSLDKGGFLEDFNWFTENAAYYGMLLAFGIVWDGVPILSTGIINASPQDWITSITYNWDTIINVISWVPSFEEFLIPPEKNGFSDFENLQRILKWLKNVDANKVNGQSGLINIAAGLSNILKNGFDAVTPIQLQEIVNLVTWSINYGPDHPEALTPQDIHQKVDESEPLYEVLQFLNKNAVAIEKFLDQGLTGPDSEAIWTDLKVMTNDLIVNNLDVDLTNNNFVGELLDNLLTKFYNLINIEKNPIESITPNAEVMESIYS